MREVKKAFWVLVIFMVMGTWTIATAGDEALFVEKCGSCHKKGGEAAPVNPADKAGSVWVKYFKRNRHPVDLGSKISAEELQKIVSYLESHAADSDQPAAAVIPK